MQQKLSGIGRHFVYEMPIGRPRMEQGQECWSGMFASAAKGTHICRVLVSEACLCPSRMLCGRQHGRAQMRIWAAGAALSGRLQG